MNDAKINTSPAQKCALVSNHLRAVPYLPSESINISTSLFVSWRDQKGPSLYRDPSKVEYTKESCAPRRLSIELRVRPSIWILII